jgi:hypothetical protein
MKITTSVTLLLILICAPVFGQKINPEEVVGSTPIRYVICTKEHSFCFLLARFSDLEDCNSYKDISDMKCDKSSDPDFVKCIKHSSPVISTSYCIK